jgi:hypothetical protein
LSKQGAHKNQTKSYIKHTDSIYKAANHKKNQQSDYVIYKAQDFIFFSNLNTPAMSKRSQYGETFFKHV